MKSKYKVHCFMTDNNNQKHIRINEDSQAVDTDYVIGVDILGNVGMKIGVDDLTAIARYLVEKAESIESCIIIPGEGELVQAHPVIVSNREQRRAN